MFVGLWNFVVLFRVLLSPAKTSARRHYRLRGVKAWFQNVQTVAWHWLDRACLLELPELNLVELKNLCRPRHLYTQRIISSSKTAIEEESPPIEPQRVKPERRRRKSTTKKVMELMVESWSQSVSVEEHAIAASGWPSNITNHLSTSLFL